ncbi:9116_t:CDS:10 [Funneliformis caledonium]|uniref:Actin-like protein ARP6 n=2 Tax=Funneliformis TaxID=1117308 RepID=A0A9N9BJS0_9GLOM|nr:755_t:CDS:10 [Funneliformis mosseae]CAG8570437.1 9116_t:CDS:10 [Funneliformis caledonium]
MSGRKVLVLDNGAYSIKAGYADWTQARTIPNCTVTRGKGDKKSYIGDQLSTCTDFTGLYYKLPFEKGFLINWQNEKEVWDRIFSKDVLNCDPKNTTLLITEPCFNLPNIQQNYDEVIFEAYEFEAYYRTIAPWLCIQNDTTSLYKDRFYKPNEVPDCALVVDSGYSFTHVVPFVMGRPILPAIRRINIGGKLLTNHLKEIVSFRYWDMMEQTYIMNEVKETCCFVSQDFLSDLEICRKNPRDNPILQEYILPDFSRNSKGYIREKKRGGVYDQSDEQVLYMNNERLSVPEILFNPMDVGMNQAGIPEVIVESINATHPEMFPSLSVNDVDLHGLLYGNIILVGGNSLFSGYKNRIEKDLRYLAPTEFEIRVGMSENPVTYAWQGGVKFANSADFNEKLVSRAEFNEYGHNICLQRFGLGDDDEIEMSE